MAITDESLVWKLALAKNVDWLWLILGIVVVGIAAYWIWYTEYRLEKDFEDNYYGV